MRAVILAGGRGTRLHPYTTVLPKPLMPIGDLPVLEILIRQLKAHGIREIIIAVGYLSELIRAYCREGERWGVRLEYSYEGDPLGTAGPLILITRRDSPLLVMNGDLLTDLDFTQLINHHKSSCHAATIGVYEHRVQLDLGIIESSASGRVVNYIEKPEYTFCVSMGVYVFEPGALRMIPYGERMDLPDLIRKLVKEDEQITTYLHKGYWRDIGHFDDYRKALEDFEVMRGRLLPAVSVT